MLYLERCPVHGFQFVSVPEGRETFSAKCPLKICLEHTENPTPDTVTMARLARDSERTLRQISKEEELANG